MGAILSVIHPPQIVVPSLDSFFFSSFHDEHHEVLVPGFLLCNSAFPLIHFMTLDPRLFLCLFLHLRGNRINSCPASTSSSANRVEGTLQSIPLPGFHLACCLMSLEAKNLMSLFSAKLHDQPSVLLYLAPRGSL